MANGFRTPRAYARGETVNIDTGSLEQDLYKVSLATGIIDARAFGGTEDVNIGPTKEQMITSAIQYAASVGATAVLVPKSMRPFTASLVTFNASVMLVDERLDLSTINVQAYGAKGDGITDDTIAIQAAIDAAVIFGGVVTFPALYYKFTGVTVRKGITLQGVSIPGGNADNVSMGFPRLLYTANGGVAITFDGSNGNSQGSGGGISRLSIIQAGGVGTVNGTAIKLTGTNNNLRATWVRIEDVQMESLATSIPWDIGIDLDGTLIGSNGVRNVWINRVRVVSDATATAALRMLSAVNVFVSNSHLNLNSKMIVSGTLAAPSSGIHIFGVNVDTLALDFVNDMELIGGQVGTITNTVNSGTGSNPITLLPGKLTNGGTYVNNAGDNCGLFYYDYPTGTWVAEGPYRIRNNRHYEGTKADGTTEVSLIGINSSDRPSLDAGGLGVWAGTPQTQITKSTGKLRPEAIERDITAASSSFSIAATHDYVRCNCTAAPIVLTLPAASTVTGQMFTLKKTDATANAASFTRAGADLIDGAVSVSTAVQYAVIRIVSNGAGWDVI